MANLKEVRSKLRELLNVECDDIVAADSEQIMAAFDRAWADVVTDLVDGNSTPEPPKKRTYVRKKKVSDPPAEQAATF